MPSKSLVNFCIPHIYLSLWSKAQSHYGHYEWEEHSQTCRYPVQYIREYRQCTYSHEISWFVFRRKPVSTQPPYRCSLYFHLRQTAQCITGKNPWLFQFSCTVFPQLLDYPPCTIPKAPAETKWNGVLLWASSITRPSNRPLHRFEMTSGEASAGGHSSKPLLCRHQIVLDLDSPFWWEMPWSIDMGLERNAIFGNFWDIPEAENLKTATVG